MVLRTAPLTHEAFAPFGKVVSAKGDGKVANQGSASRFDWLAPLENLRLSAKANLAVFASVAKSLPFEVKLLEKHPFSSQLFVPMVTSGYLVCVAPALPNDDRPDTSRLAAFLCAPNQGVIYRPGAWHHPIVALDSDAEFVMIAHEDGTSGDCVESWFPSPVTVARG